MKKLLLVLLILGGIGYAIWPYLATSSLCSSLSSGDESGVDKVVDWDALKSSVKEQVKPAVEESLRRKYGARAAQITAHVPVDEVLEKLLNDEVSPKGMVRSAKGSDPLAEAKSLSVQSRNWDGWSNFKLSISGSDDSYLFAFKGLSGWKVISMTLGDKAKQAYFPKYEAAMVKYAADHRLGTDLMKNGPSENWVLKGYVNPLDQRPATPGKGDIGTVPKAGSSLDRPPDHPTGRH